MRTIFQNARLMSLATLLLTPTLGTPAFASPADRRDPAAEIQELCDYLLREELSGFDINFGECMSYYSVPRLSGSAFAAKRCDFLLETGQFPAEGYTSYSQCVRLGAGPPDPE
jgi:hypothetical protein